MRLPRKRWITIGEAERCFVRRLNLGIPGGVRMHWRGRVAWCQPTDFTDLEELGHAIRIRLEIAGLHVVEFGRLQLGDVNLQRETIRVLVRLKGRQPVHADRF